MTEIVLERILVSQELTYSRNEEDCPGWRRRYSSKVVCLHRVATRMKWVGARGVPSTEHGLSTGSASVTGFHSESIWLQRAELKLLGLFLQGG